MLTSSCTIHNNRITDNVGFGIGFDQSSNCSIYNNNVLHNNVGIYLENYNSTSEGSGQIYYNNFSDNYQSVFGNRTGFNLLWDNGKVGNYWSDYFAIYPNATEVDKTGIGNTPYRIDQNNVDHHPLLHQVDVNSIAPTPSYPIGNLISQLTILIILGVVSSNNCLSVALC